MYFDKIILHKDGSLLVIGEQYRKDFNQWEHVYHYGDLLLMKINPDGELGWMKRMRKFKKNATYKHFTLKGEHYFVFQNHPSFSMLTELQVQKMGYKVKQKGVELLMIYRITMETGEVEILPVFDVMKASETFKLYDFKANLVCPISEYEMMLEYSIKKNESVLVKIKVGEE